MRVFVCAWSSKFEELSIQVAALNSSTSQLLNLSSKRFPKRQIKPRIARKLSPAVVHSQMLVLALIEFDT